jgi:hypothetical protein
VDPIVPFEPNRKISGHQALWLTEKNRCWHCYKTRADCQATRGANPKVCPMVGKSIAMTKGSVDTNSPGWKP